MSPSMFSQLILLYSGDILAHSNILEHMLVLLVSSSSIVVVYMVVCADVF